jgi:DNA-binding CsgD family transcriptional regulator
VPTTEDWPLVDRRAELASIRRALGAGRSGIVLAGRAGVGRSRMVREAVALAERKGHAAAWLATTRAGAGIELSAFASLLPGGRPGQGPLDLLGRVTRSLGIRPGRPRVALAVDDAQWMDDVSAAVVQQLAASGRVFVVAAVRLGEPAPDAVTALWKEGLADRVEVPALDEDALGELVRAVLDGPVSVPTCMLLWNMTHGNVLFLREVVAAGIDSGALARAGRVWRWRGPLPVGGRLGDVVEASLGPLDDDELAVLQVLAQGEPLEARILEDRFDAAVLDTVERRGLLTSIHRGSRVSLRLANPLHGEVLRARTPVLRARAVRNQIADAIEATGARRRDDALRVAGLRLASGGSVPLELLLRAAPRALASFDDAGAERAARMARHGGGGAPAALALARSLHRQGRAAEAFAVLDELDPRDLDEGQRAGAAALRAQALCWDLGRAGEAERVLAEAEVGLVGDGARDLLAAVRAAVLLFCGRLRPALEASNRVLERASGDEPARVPAAMTAAAALAAGGRAPEASPASLGVAGLDRIDGTAPFAPGPLLPTHCFSLRVAGRLDDHAAASEIGYRRAVDRGDQRTALAWAMVLGRTALDCGRVSDARGWLDEASALGHERGCLGVVPAALAWLAEAEALLGAAGDARATIARAEDLASPASALFTADIALGQAWVAAAHGDLATARSLAASAAGGAEQFDQLSTAVVALHTVVRLGGAETVSGRLRRLATRVDGPLAAACADHGDAVVAGDGAGLDEVAERFDSLGARLLAAEAAAHAAAAHCARGQRARSRVSTASARAALERCGGARTPALVGLKAPTLTRRERQVALLAAQGLSSRAIAERLGLSVRTVDNHLQVVYGKLGISGRRALPEALDPATA